MANIMIVDDSPIIRRSLRQTIEALGHAVVAEVEDGREAMRVYHQHQIDLVTMDIQMPGMDGIEAVRLIRESNPKAAIIMISSVENRNKVFEAIKLGAKHYIVKPYTDDKVREVIQAVLFPNSDSNSKLADQSKPSLKDQKDAAPSTERFPKKPAPLSLDNPALSTLPYELVLKDDRVVLTVQRHISESNVRTLQACLQGLLYYRKAKYVIELWEPIVHDVGQRLLHEFVTIVRERKGTVGVVTGDASYYIQLEAKLRNGVYRSYAEIKW